MSERYKLKNGEWRKTCEFVRDHHGSVAFRETIVRDKNWKLLRVEHRAEPARKPASVPLLP